LLPYKELEEVEEGPKIEIPFLGGVAGVLFGRFVTNAIELTVFSVVTKLIALTTPYAV
jgi:hypothetical protein